MLRVVCSATSKLCTSRAASRPLTRLPNNPNLKQRQFDGGFFLSVRSITSTENRNNNNNTTANNNGSNNKEKKRSDDSQIINKFKAYLDLSKFRLSSLVVFTTAAGFLSAGGPVIWDTMMCTCFGTAFCAASASTFNQIFEIERDKQMNRTKNRPLPSNKVTIGEAAALGISTGTLGAVLLYSTSHPLTAALGVANIALYSGAYTYSKRVTEWNTWIGSVVGAIPPVMGYVAATNGHLISAEPMLLASTLFLWQFPHFFSLSWMHREDYARGGFQMVSTNDVDGSRSASLIYRYSLFLSALPVLSSAFGVTTYMFAVEGIAANAYLLYLASKFHKDRSNANARRIFLCSLWYLPLLLAGFVVHSKSWNKDVLTEGESGDSYEDDASVDFERILARITDQGKKICVHEMIAVGNREGGGKLCAKIGAENSIEQISPPAIVCDSVDSEGSNDDNNVAKKK